MSADTQPDLKIAGYCRVCGKALTEADVRTAQGTIYCVDHVFQEAPPPIGGTGPSFYPGSYTPPADSPYTRPTPPPVPDGASAGTG